MKITCESCAAQYDLDESRIPPSGVQMKCPACLHQFLVKKPAAGAAPAARKEIALSEVDDDVTPLPPDLPGMAPPAPAQKSQPSIALADLDEMDLPAPKKASGSAPAQGPNLDEIDLPAPKSPSSSRFAKVPAMSPPDTVKSPPAAVKPQPAAVKPPPAAVKPPPAAAKPPVPPPTAARPPSAPPPMPAARKPPPAPITDEPTGDESRLNIRPPSKTPLSAGEDLIDLPAPVSTTRQAALRPPADEIDLPGPRSTAGPAPIRPEELDLPAPRGSAPAVRNEPGLTDLPAPKRAPSAVDLDAPDPDDMALVASPPARQAQPQARTAAASFEMPTADDGMPGIDIESIDVVAPKHAAPSSTASADEPDLPAPKLETMEVAPKMPAHADRSLDDPTPVEAIKPDYKAPAKKAAAAEFDDEDEAPKKRRGMGALIAVGAVLVIVGGVGAGLGLFTSHGWFGMNLLSGKSAAGEAKLQSARKLMQDDTLASYRKAALDLKQLSDTDPKLHEALALEAQARLAEARLGVQAEGGSAEALIAKLPVDPKEVTPEIARARALKSVVLGAPAQARTELQTILASAPSDATALTYLGWLEQSNGDFVAADAAFAKAVQAEPGRAAALYGQAVADERLGNVAQAADLYARTLSRSADHFGAAVGGARLEAARLGGLAAQQKIEELIAKRASVAAPRELADAWATVGVIAQQAGRRDEAEDRLKKALQLDPASTTALVAMADVQCEAGKAQQQIAPMTKLVAAQPKNLEARLALVRALVEGGQPKEGGAALLPLTTQAPKDARVLYWQGRVALADRGDREGALKLFKDAVTADPRYIAAYLAESNTFAQLGKNEEALDALKQAEAKASDDPQLMLELGQAYLTIHRAADAEARFRAALEKRPDFLPARVALGAALEAENKTDDAAKEYAEVAAKQADYPGLTERQASLAARLGRKEEAWALYGKALGQGVPTAFLKLQVAQLALDLNKLDDARKLAEEVAKEDDRNAVAHLVLARAMLAKHSPEEALAESRRAATLADLPEAHLALARSLELLGKLDQSVQEYNLARRGGVEGEASIGRARIMVRMGATRDALADLTVLARDPKLRAQALLLQGDCFADLSQKDKARRSYEDAVKAAPESGEATFKLGRAYFDAGRRHEASNMLEKALKVGGDQASYAIEAWLLTADAHRESKEKDAAVRAYKKYLELAPPDAPARNEVTRQLKILEGG